MTTSLRWLSIGVASIFLVISFVSAQSEDQFIFNGFNHTELLSIDGIAKILPSGLLQLTNTSINKLGRAFYKFPFKFDASSFSFSTSFVFAIVPNVSSSTSGHGMAFVISSTMNFSDAETNFDLGIFNSSNIKDHVLAIEFDTVETPSVKDIDGNHVGIDVNSLVSIKAASATYFSSEEGKNKNVLLTSGDSIRVWIDYNGTDMSLNVTIAPITSQRPKVPLLSSVINVSNIFLENIFVGFSASTGNLVGKHYVRGWSFSQIGTAQDLDDSKLPPLPPPPPPPFSPPPPPPSPHPKWKIIIPVALGILLVSVVGGIYLYESIKYREVLESWEIEYSPQRFSYKKLYKATEGFSEKEVLGQGGFGKVYRGKLQSKVEVAVKKVSHNSKQGMQEFVTEIVSMKKLGHKNLVQLLGYCRRKGELLLVYEYMPNKSLDKILFNPNDMRLNWPQRFHIIKGISSALLYLHEGWEEVVLHRDVKSSNVLLDSNLNGKLGDFGLAKFHEHGNVPQLSSRLVGTIGHLAPELFRSGVPTKSTDVYAFGAFLLEVVCGRKPIESQGKSDEVILVESVFRCWEMGDLLGAMDPKLNGTFVLHEVELVLKLGMLCHSVSDKRPSMRQLMQYLDGNDTLVDFVPDEAGIYRSGGARHEVSNTIVTFASSSHSINTDDSILTMGR